MKKILFTALLALLATGVGAQEQQKEEGYRFTDVKTLPVTSIKNQNRSGTCWAYSALAFLATAAGSTTCRRCGSCATPISRRR